MPLCDRLMTQVRPAQQHRSSEIVAQYGQPPGLGGAVMEAVRAQLGTSDNMESNMSSFMVEMAGAASVLQSVTPRSLVLFDELGRGYGCGRRLHPLLVSTPCSSPPFARLHPLRVTKPCVCACRTAHTDGAAIAWAVCEALLHRGTSCMCVSHFEELEVRNCSMLAALL